METKCNKGRYSNTSLIEKQKKKKIAFSVIFNISLLKMCLSAIALIVWVAWVCYNSVVCKSCIRRNNFFTFFFLSPTGPANKPA